MPRFLALEPRLHVHDLARAVAFYRDSLGFRVTTLFPEHQPVFAMMARDGTCIQLGGPAGRRAQGDPSTCTLYFDVADVVELHRHLAALGPIEWGPEVFFYGRREFAVRDPDGNLLVFSEVTTDPPTCREG
ncbi:MAG: glyoxalase superfamily protein [Planctomycetota bacterium]